MRSRLRGDTRWSVDSLGWKGRSGGLSADAVVEGVVHTAMPGRMVLVHVGANLDDGTTLADLSDLLGRPRPPRSRPDRDPNDVRGYATRAIVRVVASVAVARADWFWIASVWTGEPRIMERLKFGYLCWFPLASLPIQFPTTSARFLKAS